MGPCAGLSVGFGCESAAPETAAAACPGLLLTWAVGDGGMGLFRMVFRAPGLEQGGGDARGGWKGDDADEVGCGDGCWTGGLDF